MEIRPRDQDADGRTVTRVQLVDTLALMLRNKTITHDEHEAGRKFQAQFTLAMLDQLKAQNFEKGVDVGISDWPSLTETAADYRNRVWRAIEAIGGIGSAGGSIVWHVVGLGETIADWCRRVGRPGRSIRPHEATGYLVSALGALLGHYERGVWAPKPRRGP